MNSLTEIRALHEALDDEYLAWATYDQVIADFGEVRPFSNIREAEARHIEALCTLFARYGLGVLGLARLTQLNQLNAKLTLTH